MNFVAIDFETANASRTSACEIGVTVVQEGTIIDTYSHLIRPKENYFNFFNTKIHGINAKMVSKEPEFPEVWQKIQSDFQDSVLVAHNANFDMAVLKSCLKLYKLEVPKSPYICTVQIARKVWPELDRFRLNRMAEFLGLDFKHHKAEDDARVCAEILLAAMRKKNAESVVHLLQEIKLPPKNLVQLDNLGPTGPARKMGLPKPNKKADKTGYFHKKEVVFTRALKSMPRPKAYKLVAQLGALPSSEISPATKLLVVGGPDFRENNTKPVTTKLKKALKGISQGQTIEIISEQEFLDKIPLDLKQKVLKR